MKKYLMGAAALFAIAAPAVAHADDVGTLGVHYANLDPDNSDSIDSYGLDLGFVHSLDSGLAVQATANSDRIDGGGGNNIGVSYAAFALGTKMDSGSYYGWATHETFFGDAWGLGGGGRWDVSQAVVNASVGWADFNSTGVTNVNVDATWFLSDDFGIGADVGYVDVEDSGNATIYGVNGTYRFTGTPIAMNLGYDHVDGEGSDLNRWTVGFQWQFGSSSAHENASHGTWNGAERQYENTVLSLF